MTLVDTNVLLDIATDDPKWGAWSLAGLESAALNGPVLINAVIYAEFSVGYRRIEDVDRVLRNAGIEIAEIPRSALFLAAKAFLQYKKKGGSRGGVLPDFFIGAHAAVERWPLLTRDSKRYETYFPTVTLLAPEHRNAR